MASTNLDEIGVRSLAVPDWSGGINTAQPPTEIQDNEAQDILNLEFDDSGNLATRSGVTELFSNSYAQRMTSIHYFSTESGEVGVLFTAGSGLYIVQTDGTGETDITGALSLPSDNFWQWETFGGLAIGVNKSTTAANPVKVNTSSVAAALGGSPPKGKYIKVWNSRLWIVSATEPNQLWASSLGNPEDWTTTGDAGFVTIDIDPDDGDEITGLWPMREALYVFKRQKIYRVVPVNAAEAPTVASNLKVELYAKNIGCVSAYSIQAVLDDVLFLSEQGVASLSLAPAAEDFRTALFSRNVAEIARTPKTTDEFTATVFDTASQYLLSIPASVSLSTTKQAYVLDYAQIDRRIVRWTRFDGFIAGTAYTSWIDPTYGKVFAVAAENQVGNYQIFIYKPKDITVPYSDNGNAYNKRLITKSYTAGAMLLRKHWQKWGFSFDALSGTAAVAVQYYFDGNLSKGGSYAFNITSIGDGALWDSAVWDVAYWDTAVPTPQDIVRRLLTNSSGQKSQTITFIVSNGQDEQGITIKDFMLWFSMLTEKKVSDV